MPYGGRVFRALRPHQIITLGENIKPTRGLLGEEIKCFAALWIPEKSTRFCFFGKCPQCVCATYVGPVGGFSWRQGAGTEDRGAGRTAELGEGVGDGREGRRPQLLLLLLQPPGTPKTGSKRRPHCRWTRFVQ